jgi:formate/nitrite transporter FocA (FNT family)
VCKITLKQQTKKLGGPHICITSFAIVLMLHIIIHMDMAIWIAFDNNEYPWDRFKAHKVTTRIKKNDVLCAMAHV